MRTVFERAVVGSLADALKQNPALLHILIGARQTGKSTAAQQVEKRWGGPVIFATADAPLPPGPEWIETHWTRARESTRDKKSRRPVLLILDEIQKVRGWSEMVKAQWEEDRRTGCRVRVLLLGSSALLVSKGLTESLAGRFLLHRCPHWSFAECREAFRWNLDRWIYFGGYPGAARLVRNENLWRQYVADSLIETAIARDVLSLEKISKPALLRHLFGLAAQYPAQIISYTKLLGSLHDAGNTVTLSHYLRLLEQCFLVSGLERSTGRIRKRGSIPKIVFWNNALITALSGTSFRSARQDAAAWGRLVENAVGAHLLNHLTPPRFSVGYWRERNDEVDFIVSEGARTLAIEVKSGRPGRLAGMEAFRKSHPKAKSLIVGSGGMPLEEFFLMNPGNLLEASFS